MSIDVTRSELWGCGVPRRLWPLFLGSGLDENEAMATVRSWLRGDKTFLMLGGSRGIGKSTAAAWAVLQYPGRVERDGVQYPISPGLFRSAQDVAALSVYDTAAWSELFAAPMVALDDLGTEWLDDKGWALAAIRRLLDARYDGAARTVITLNLSVSATRARYDSDGRLYDRLRESAVWVELGGDSLRKP